MPFNLRVTESTAHLQDAEVARNSNALLPWKLCLHFFDTRAYPRGDKNTIIMLVRSRCADMRGLISPARGTSEGEAPCIRDVSS
jgi:hypothetical protein